MLFYNYIYLVQSIIFPFSYPKGYQSEIFYVTLTSYHPFAMIITLKKTINSIIMAPSVSANLVRTALYGKVFKPAYTAYSMTPINVHCDHCGSKNIAEAVHYAEYDICQQCCAYLLNISQKLKSVPQPCPSGVCKPEQNEEVCRPGQMCQRPQDSKKTPIDMYQNTDPNIARMLQDRDVRMASHMGVDFDREAGMTRTNNPQKTYSKRGTWESYFSES
jgi:hypothetical protein